MPRAAKLNDFGRRLEAERKRLGLSKEGVRSRLGVSRSTLWRMMHQTPITLSEAQQTEILERIRREEPSTGPTTTVPKGLPQRARIWLHEFLLELARGGATDQEIESARRLLISEEAHAFYSGGHTELSEEELLLEMQGLAEGIRRRLRLRGRQV